MIKLTHLPKPSELTPQIEKELTDEYQKTGKSVWQQDYIKRDLLKMPSDKCCYCECNVNEESKYLEIEHFKPKHHFPNLVVDWDNLLPACKGCNGVKSDHNTQTEPIVHPVNDNPKDHLAFKAYRLKAKTDLGKKTLEVIPHLNNTKKVVTKRFDIGEKIIESLQELLELTQDYSNGIQSSNQRRNRIISKLRAIMQEGCPETEYSAIAATTTLNDDNYQIIKQLFINSSLWSQEFVDLEQKIQFCALDIA
jgi:uncharacterized protein (TIGR02646 family)